LITLAIPHDSERGITKKKNELQKGQFPQLDISRYIPPRKNGAARQYSLSEQIRNFPAVGAITPGQTGRYRFIHFYLQEELRIFPPLFHYWFRQSISQLPAIVNTRLSG